MWVCPHAYLCGPIENLPSGHGAYEEQKKFLNEWEWGHEVKTWKAPFQAENLVGCEHWVDLHLTSQLSNSWCHSTLMEFSM